MRTRRTVPIRIASLRLCLRAAGGGGSGAGAGWAALASELDSAGFIGNTDAVRYGAPTAGRRTAKVLPERKSSKVCVGERPPFMAQVIFSSISGDLRHCNSQPHVPSRPESARGSRTWNPFPLFSNPKWRRGPGRGGSHGETIPSPHSSLAGRGHPV